MAGWYFRLPQWNVYESLTRQEQVALRHYSQTAYGDINDMLESGEYQELSASGEYDNLSIPELKEKLRVKYEAKGYTTDGALIMSNSGARAYSDIKLITSAFEKVEPLTTAITVWRGVSSSESDKIDFTDDESIARTSRDDYLPEPWRVPDFTRVSFISTTADINYALYSYVSSEPYELERPSCCLMEILVSPGSKILPLKGGYSHLRESEILLPYWGQLILTNTEIRDLRYRSSMNNEMIQMKVRVYQLTYIP